MSRPSSGTQQENLDIPHTGPLLEVLCHSRLPDQNIISREQPVQPGSSVRFRSEYGRKSCIPCGLSLLFCKIEQYFFDVTYSL